ncbi:nuclear transport factor 2 family protein [Chitinophaga varians]|uniref:nuclear transport factor 2 family protein n=1 Tax=Chitinophaga varians TaxID=2202339 RepID=UPI00165FD47C|nr:nuclear transport factor 2 family protein [Chitinophaga varians]MBC9909383.1 nuclear transport factor 2 family protein [Chitinophaga varians]
MNTVAPYTPDYIAIQQLISQYTHVINLREWDQLEQIFSENATWQALAPVNLKWEGLSMIKTELPASVERMEILIQSTSGTVITMESANTAHAKSLITEFGRNKETKEGMQATGYYHDVLVKENDTWKFLSRTFTLIYFESREVAGTLVNYKY